MIGGMYEYIRGKIVEKDPSLAVVDAGGVGDRKSVV